MAGVVPSYEYGPITYEANVAITGGQLVEPDAATGRVKPAAALSKKCLGVAMKDAIPASTNQNATQLTLDPVSKYVPVDCNRVFRLTATGAIAFGEQVVCAANGTVAPVGANTFDTVVGRCLEPLGIANGAKGLIKINI